MSARLFFDHDCSLEALASKTIVVVGYGNQGRAQTLNLRDTLNKSTVFEPPSIIVANREDEYAVTADQDQFGHTSNWSEAAAQADVLILLVPDQVQPKLFNEELAPTLKPTACVVVASGYNVFYKYLSISPSNDVVMVAPRMIGASVRSRYVREQGFPCFVSAERDATGRAWPIALALCLGIGAAKGGVIGSSCREETLLDLFAEQAIFPMIIATFREGYKLLKQLGCTDEVLVHELWLSKEPVEIFEKMADDGFIRQLALHSTVSQYGQLKGSMEINTSSMVSGFKLILEEQILGGRFADEFSRLENEAAGGVDAKIKQLYDIANQSDLAKGEERVRRRLGLD